MTNKLAVEQVDRDAAEAWRRDFGRKASYQDLLQAFARHRQQAEARAEGLELALQEHHEWQMRFDLDDPEHGFNYATEYADSGMCERTLAALTAYRSARP